MTVQVDRRRRWRVVVWLLTPLVVWAASFCGGWVGATMARDAAQAASGPVRLGLGALAGGGIGLILCLIVIRALRQPQNPH